MTVRQVHLNDLSQLETLFQQTRQRTFTLRDPDEFQWGDYTQSVAEDDVWVVKELGTIVGFISI